MIAGEPLLASVRPAMALQLVGSEDKYPLINQKYR